MQIDMNNYIKDCSRKTRFGDVELPADYTPKFRAHYHPAVKLPNGTTFNGQGDLIRIADGKILLTSIALTICKGKSIEQLMRESANDA